MKHLLIIIILFNCYLLHSQKNVDTTEVKSVRYEWKISPITNKTVLNTTLTEYKSGFFKEETNFMNNYYSKDSLNEFGFYKVYKEGFNNPLLELSKEKLYINALLNNLQRLYYDKHGNLDSLVNTINRPVFEKVKIVQNNVYKRKNKLKYITTNPSRDSVTFKYNFFGRLKAIEFYKDSKLHKILRYKKNLLFSEQIFESKKFKKTLRNEYNENRQLIRKDIDDNYFHRYLYENDLLIKKEYQDEELKEEFIYKYE